MGVKVNKYRTVTFQFAIAIVFAFLASYIALFATSPTAGALGVFLEALVATAMGFGAAKTYYQSPG